MTLTFGYQRALVDTAVRSLIGLATQKGIDAFRLDGRAFREHYMPRAPLMVVIRLDVIISEYLPQGWYITKLEDNQYLVTKAPCWYVDFNSQTFQPAQPHSQRS